MEEMVDFVNHVLAWAMYWYDQEIGVFVILWQKNRRVGNVPISNKGNLEINSKRPGKNVSLI
jgi:hypothetical protein